MAAAAKSMFQKIFIAINISNSQSDALLSKSPTWPRRPLKSPWQVPEKMSVDTMLGTPGLEAGNVTQQDKSPMAAYLLLFRDISNKNNL